MSKKEDSAKQINISEFKTHCLKLLDETSRKGKEYTITKKGQPIARVVPIQKNFKSLRGSMEGLIKIHGDIVHFDTSDEWEVLKE